MWAWAVFMACLLGCGCGDDPEGGVGDASVAADEGARAEDIGVGVDAGAAPDGGATSPVVIGTGIDSFIELQRDGTQVFPIVLGPQGGGRFEGHHVELAVRLNGITPSDLSLLEVRVLDESGEIRATVLRDPARSPFVAGRDLPNLAPRLDDCCLVAGRSVVVEVLATPVSGPTLRDQVSGVATSCPQASQGASICP